MIEVDDLSKSFAQLHAVRNVSFKVARGEVLGFLGPNGAGKSTTMKMITGFLEPSAGHVRVCGHDVASAPLAAKRRIGYLPEGAPLYGEMTTRGFLEFVADVRGLHGDARAARIAQVIAKVHLEGVLEQRVETLSKGFKRRVGVAQAILHDPDVLIMDEPTDGLDPNQKHEVRSLIAEMAKDKAIVISTHILEEVDAVCNRVIIIAAGALVFAGTPAELAARSRYHNAVRLAVRDCGFEDVRAALSARAGVGAVEALDADGDFIRVLVTPSDGARIIDVVSDAARTGRWDVAEMTVESGHLDEVFRTITTAGAAGVGSAAP
ncbi:MAG: ATP-binding cassette domain-containing protein [Gammaproteobacteria bacterium]|nr:ATP-binding cassette domain-containing protein [Gammaproteobacteria bacterium]